MAFSLERKDIKNAAAHPDLQLFRVFPQGSMVPNTSKKPSTERIVAAADPFGKPAVDPSRDGSVLNSLLGPVYPLLGQD